MGIVLFDWKNNVGSQIAQNPLLSYISLFDGYLTEPLSYPHFEHIAYLTEPGIKTTQTAQNPLLSYISLFDGYLTEQYKIPKTN